ncbi:16S rRNA (guanine(527)-N(7))-methyltransferase RsmG [Desulfobacterales bacterium HSG16]|nr:16S rRNA (guanine(527)-N(7))-methyltransferase RsmG [Desulfobacterales bacterium HSG16]
MDEIKIGSKKWMDLIITGAEKLHLCVNREMAGMFAEHADELALWNRKTNLTAIVNPADVAVKHFIDSVAAAPFIPPDSFVLDIGSGAGFPAIPLKVVLPSIKVLMIDASRKKISFLKQVIYRLKLDRIEALHIRAENLACKNQTNRKNLNYENAFDVIICRAFSNLDSFIDMALPLVSEKGKIIALKGKFAGHKIDNLKKRLTEKGKKDINVKIHQFELPFVHADRTVISICLGGH